MYSIGGSTNPHTMKNEPPQPCQDKKCNGFFFDKHVLYEGRCAIKRENAENCETYIPLSFVMKEIEQAKKAGV
jgi:hypothetical protein